MDKAKEETSREGAYEYAWDNWRLIQIAYWGLSITFLPIMAVSAKLFGAVIGQIITAVWAISWLVVGGLKYNWRCPRCGKRFHSNWWLSNMPVRKCLHCKLPKYAKTDSDPAGKFLD